MAQQSGWRGWDGGARKKGRYTAPERRIVDGISFASIAEAKHYGELSLLQQAGKVQNLVVHPRFPIWINGVKVCTVILDFSYFDVEAQRHRWIDVKGHDNAMSQLRRKLLEASYPLIKVEVIRG